MPPKAGYDKGSRRGRVAWSGRPAIEQLSEPASHGPHKPESRVRLPKLPFCDGSVEDTGLGPAVGENPIVANAQDQQGHGARRLAVRHGA